MGHTLISIVLRFLCKFLIGYEAFYFQFFLVQNNGFLNKYNVLNADDLNVYEMQMLKFYGEICDFLILFIINWWKDNFRTK